MKGYKHLTKDQKQSILHLYDETKSTEITATRLGLKRATVAQYLKRQGIERTGYRQSACTRNFDLVVQMAQDGQSYSEIGRVVGTTGHRVRDFLDRYEIDHPGHIQIGKDNPNWKGGKMIDKDGYVLLRLPDHPLADSHGYVREHRLVMSQKIGRLVEPDEVVHHIDNDHQNNDPGNLKLYHTNGDHLAETLKGQIPNWTPDGWERMQRGCRKKRGHKRKSIPAES